jgi:hypothetical protein
VGARKASPMTVVASASMERRPATGLQRVDDGVPDDSSGAEGTGSTVSGGGTDGGGGGIVLKYAKILRSEVTTHWARRENRDAVQNGYRHIYSLVNR